MLNDEIKKLGLKCGLVEYHVNYLIQFLKEYDVSSKDVLEVGGAMPSEIVINLLGANSWNATEAASYDADLGGAANQQTLLAEKIW